MEMWHEIGRHAGDAHDPMTTHYLEEADGLAQRLAIDQGIVVAEGTPDELKGELRAGTTP